MTREQLAAFLSAAEKGVADFHPLFYLMSRTGVRLGEGLALEWGDVHLEREHLRVERSLARDGSVNSPKSGHGRTVDLGAAAVAFLEKRQPVEVTDSSSASDREFINGDPGLLFSNTWSQPFSHSEAQAAFRMARVPARLQGFTPHS
ncbi:hypothetical protein LCGC14_2417390, partial [marine sediment metagenome]